MYCLERFIEIIIWTFLLLLFLDFLLLLLFEESYLQNAVTYVQKIFKSDYFGFGKKKPTEQGEIDDDAEQIVGDPFGFLSGPPTPGSTMDPATGSTMDPATGLTATGSTTTALPTTDLPTTTDSRRQTNIGGMKIHNRRRSVGEDNEINSKFEI